MQPEGADVAAFLARGAEIAKKIDLSQFIGEGKGRK